MNCLAIGDLLIPSRYFDEALASSPMFTEYKSLYWNISEDRKNMRDVVRAIETMGSKSFSVPDIIVDQISEVEALFVHLCPVPADLIESAHKLKYIVTARGGLENIDVEAARKRNITIINTPTHNAIAVAEYTIGLILCETRNIARSNMGLREGIWIEQYDNTSAIPELVDSTIGLIGFGTIGRLVAQRLRVFGAKIQIFDPFIGNEEIEKYGYKKVEFDELLKTSDILSLHGRLPVNSPPLITIKELKLMKKTAYLINTARASMINMDDLNEALQNEDIMGAAIDVYPVEPLPDDFSLLKRKNVTLTNHRGGDTLNSYIKAPYIMLEQLRKAESEKNI